MNENLSGILLKSISPLPDVCYARSSIIWLRIISSLAWLDSALVGKDAKLSYAFLSGAELAKRVGETFVLTAVTPGVVAFLRNVVLPHAQIFAILIGFGDLMIGISLSVGIFTRLGSVLAILRALANILVAGGAGPDTVGFNVMLIAAGAIGLTTGAGRRFGIDSLLLARWPAAKLLRLVA
jgi:thiosulfate dehydrogenase (quinone) large subunit